MTKDLNELCAGKTIQSLNVYSIYANEGCYGEIVFTDGSKLNISDEPIFEPAPPRVPTKVYRVLYYTERGTMIRDFMEADAKEKAQAFYNRHVKAHPDYQTRTWSRAEIVSFDV